MTTTTADAYAGRRSQYMTPALDVFPAHLRAQVQAVETARVAWLKAEDAYGAAVKAVSAADTDYLQELARVAREGGDMDAVARPHEQRQAEADRAHTIAAVAKQEVAARFWALHDALATDPATVLDPLDQQAQQLAEHVAEAQAALDTATAELSAHLAVYGWCWDVANLPGVESSLALRLQPEPAGPATLTVLRGLIAERADLDRRHREGQLTDTAHRQAVKALQARRQAQRISEQEQHAATARTRTAAARLLSNRASTGGTFH